MFRKRVYKRERGGGVQGRERDGKKITFCLDHILHLNTHEFLIYSADFPSPLTLIRSSH